MSKPKEISIEIIKTQDGFKLCNKTEYRIELFRDDDNGRHNLIQVLVDQLLNAEVENGRKYN